MSLLRFSSHRNLSRFFLILLVFLILTGAFQRSNATAQTAPTYDLSWWSIDGGAGTLSAGSYLLSGVIGQSDAQVLTRGNYELYGGFWHAPSAPPVSQPKLYLPLTIR